MKVLDLHPAFAAKARTQVQRERYRLWRGQVERFQAAFGARQTLVHVPEEVWRGQFAANDDAVSAVVTQLEKFDD